MRKSLKKLCKKCGQDSWYIRKNGKQSDCAVCINKYKSLNKKSINKQRVRFRKKHKKEIAQYNKKYYINNSESEKKRTKKYIKSHPELYLFYNRKRRASKKKVNENFTTQEINITKKIFNNKCFNCGSYNDFRIDHHMPLSKGYALTLLNAVLLCTSCNN